MTDDDHRRLLELVKTVSGMVLISGYASELYDATLAGWRRVTVDARTDGNAERVEVLWMNHAAAAAGDERRDLIAGGHGMPLFGSVA